MLTRVLRACGLVATTVVLLVATARAQQASPADDPKALFEAGVSYLQEEPEPKYEEALELLRACYAKSRSFRALLPMGVCELHLERDGDAIAHFRQYLAEGGTEVPPDLRAQAERDIAMLSASLVRVTVGLKPVGATLIHERTPAQGAPIVNRYAATQPIMTLGIHPGRHKFTVTSDGRVPKVWSFEAAPGATLSAQFRPEAKPTASPPPESSEARRPSAPRTEAPSRPGPKSGDERSTPGAVYVGLVATGALAAGATVTGIVALSNHSAFEKENSAFHEGKASELRTSGRQLNLLADVLIGATLLAAGGTAYLYFSSEGRSATPNTRTGTRVRLVAEPPTGLVQVLGHF